MENKINIKELAKNLKSLPLTEGVKENEVIVTSEVKENKIMSEIAEKKTKTQQVKKAQPKQTISRLTETTEMIMTLQTDMDNYDFSKQVWIDEDIYEILVHIKRREKIKNISILVTSIIEQYINQNRAAIVKLLNDKPKKI